MKKGIQRNQDSKESAGAQPEQINKQALASQTKNLLKELEHLIGKGLAAGLINEEEAATARTQNQQWVDLLNSRASAPTA